MAQKDDAKSPVKPEKKGSSGIVKVLLITVIALILVGGSVGVTLFLTGALHKNASEETPATSSSAAHAAPAPAHAAPAPAHAAPIAARLPPVYLALDPPFIVNFDDQGMSRYLQVGLSVMARNQQVLDAVTANMPQIRNDLILLFANQKLDILISSEGKEKLRSQALGQIQAVLSREIGQAGIEAVYFTAFVMQ